MYFFNCKYRSVTEMRENCLIIVHDNFLFLLLRNVDLLNFLYEPNFDDLTHSVYIMFRRFPLINKQRDFVIFFICL